MKFNIFPGGRNSSKNDVRPVDGAPDRARGDGSEYVIPVQSTPLVRPPSAENRSFRNYPPGERAQQEEQFRANYEERKARIEAMNLSRRDFLKKAALVGGILFGGGTSAVALYKWEQEQVNREKQEYFDSQRSEIEEKIASGEYQLLDAQSVEIMDWVYVRTTPHLLREINTGTGKPEIDNKNFVGKITSRQLEVSEVYDRTYNGKHHWYGVNVADLPEEFTENNFIPIGCEIVWMNDGTEFDDRYVQVVTSDGEVVE